MTTTIERLVHGSMFAVLAVIAVSPSIAGYAVRMSVAAPLAWSGLVDDSTALAIVLWSAF
jgi:hypothetical protein